MTLSHLIAYDPERDLLPLILAHCNYSLEVGQETLVHYDWAALERQLIDRLLRGRPFVEFKVGWKYLEHIAHDDKKSIFSFSVKLVFTAQNVFILFILLLSLLHLTANSFNLIFFYGHVSLVKIYLNQSQQFQLMDNKSLLILKFQRWDSRDR